MATKKSDRPIVIMGAGQAAAQAALSLRQKEGYEGELVMLGEEMFPPYQRPPLSKQFLSGDLAKEKVFLRPESFWQSLDVVWQGGIKAQALDIGRREIQLAGSKKPLVYEKLLIATGGAAHHPLPDLAGEEIISLRTLSDAKKLRTLLKTGKKLAILGAGYIGLEVAASARKLGLAVEVFEARERPLARTAAPQLAEFFRRRHEKEGVVFHFGAKLASVQRRDRLELLFASGARHEADCLLLATGLAPATALAQQAGLKLARGRIITDKEAKTSAPDIWAAGDCASHASSFAGGEQIALESVQNAVEQAKRAAASLCGHAMPPPAVPWFWSDQYACSLKQAGLAIGHDELLCRGTPESGSFCLFYLKGKQLLAADCLNRPAEFMAVRQLLAQNRSASPPMLVDESIKPKEWLAIDD